MSNSALTKVLTNIGLNEKEARIYLACIEMGTSPVSSIAQNAKINRVTTYDILEKLKSRGLVSFFTKKKIKYFTAIEPEILVEEFERRTNELRSSLPIFKRISGEAAHPHIRYFEGLEGIKSIYTDTLTSKTEILNFSNSHEIRQKWPEYDHEYVEERRKRGIFLRGISPQDPEGAIVQSENKKYYREIRLITEPEFNFFTNEINIYDDKVAIISFKDELIGMILESAEIANSQRAIFNMCWKLTELIETKGKAHKNKLLQRIHEEELKKSISPNKSNKKREETPLQLF